MKGNYCRFPREAFESVTSISPIGEDNDACSGRQSAVRYLCKFDIGLVVVAEWRLVNRAG